MYVHLSKHTLDYRKNKREPCASAKTFAFMNDDVINCVIGAPPVKTAPGPLPLNPALVTAPIAPEQHSRAADRCASAFRACT